MATEIGYFTPKQAERVWRNTLAFEKQPVDANVSDRQFVPSSISFVNRSGFTIPPYGCIQIAGTEEIGGRNYLAMKRPIQYGSAVIGPFLFNNDREVPNNDFGTAQSGPIFRSLSDGISITIGTRIGPLQDSFAVGKGCLFSYFGDDDIADDIIRTMSCETPLIAEVITGPLPAGGMGTAQSKLATLTGWGSGGVQYDAWNFSSTSISAGKTVIMFPIDARWAAVEVC